jgi:flagellar biosynthetic protein FliR
LIAYDAGLIGFSLVFCRVAGTLAWAPVFSSQRIPARFKLILSGFISFAIAPLVTPKAVVPISSLEGVSYALAVATEIMVGSVFGLSVRLFFLAFETMAMVCSMAVGLTMAFTIPSDAVEALPPLASMLVAVALMCVVGLDLHIEILSQMIATYNLVPIGAGLSAQVVAASFVAAFNDAFRICLRFASPFIVMGVSLNLGFGILNRVTGQLSLFFVSMPFLIAAGLGVLLAGDQRLYRELFSGFELWFRAL